MEEKKREEALAEILQLLEKQLPDATIQPQENLIEYGLNSIMVMQISAKLRKCGFKIPFVKLMEQPTLAHWEDLLSKSSLKPVGRRKDEKVKEVSSPFALTDVQYAYYVGRREEQVLGGVSCHAYMEFDGEALDADRLQAAWKVLLMHHPMLRAKFFGDGMQEIMAEPYTTEITLVDLREESHDVICAKLEALRADRSHRKLRVELGEVAALALVQLPDEKRRMILDVDLLVADVASIGILLDDLACAYENGALEGAEEKTFQWYLSNRETTDYKKQQEDLEFWQAKIDAMPQYTPNLYLETEPEKLGVPHCTRRTKHISAETWQKLRGIAGTYQVTPSMVLMAAYGLVIERWSNQNTFFINVPLFNRMGESEYIERMVADFTNLMLVDYYRNAQESFLETVQRVQESFLENMAHGSCNGISVQRMVQKKFTNPINVAPVVFACNIDAPIESEKSRSVFSDMSYMISQTPQVWLDCQIYEKDGALSICWDTVDGLLPVASIEAMQGAYVALLERLVESNAWNVCPDVFPQEQADAWTREIQKVKETAVPEGHLLSDFLQQAVYHPDAVALLLPQEDAEMTYGELLDEALSIAEGLKTHGVKPKDYVGIQLPRGKEQIIAALGVLLCGACYVPMGMNQPKARLDAIREQIGICYTIMALEDVRSKTTEASIPAIPNIAGRDSAYIIMTSGSTGVPKCVEIAHESARNTILDVSRIAGVTRDTVGMTVASFDFDLSVYDIFGILGAGGRLMVLTEESAKVPEIWMDYMERYGVNFWNSTPMAFDMCMTYAESKEKKVELDTVLLSGDWIALDLPGRFYAMQPKGTVISLGGATEASIWSNYLVVPKVIPSHWKTIPYGYPLRGQLYRVMDDLGRVCPTNVAGELWIGGIGVAKGYRGDAALTAEKFPQGDIPWYRTGDMGMIWADGTIEFLGRKDHQVKIKGYRIELGEVESAVNKLPQIQRAVVETVDHTRGKQLAVFTVLHPGVEFDEAQLKTGLEEYLPTYMIPEVFVVADRILLTNNGKPNRKAIKEVLKEQQTHTSAEAPVGEIEKAIYQVWSEVLETEDISREDNYFRLGGDSLKAVTIITKLEERLNIPVEWNTNFLYKAPTIHALGDLISQSMEEMEEDVI